MENNNEFFNSNTNTNNNINTNTNNINTNTNNINTNITNNKINDINNNNISNNSSDNKHTNKTFIIWVLLFSIGVSIFCQSFILFAILMILALIEKEKIFKVLFKLFLFTIVAILIVFGVCYILVAGLAGMVQ